MRTWPWRTMRRWGLAALTACLTILAVTGAPEPTFASVVGVLPDGTRYELRVPWGTEIGKAEYIGGVVVWAKGHNAGTPIGVTRFSRRPPTCSGIRDVAKSTVCDGRLVVPTKSWSMVVDLYDYSVDRGPILEMIQARRQDGLIVLELPEALRFSGVRELPVEMEVRYSSIRVVRGCVGGGKCSADGRVSVVAVGNGVDSSPDTDVSGIRIRSLPRAVLRRP